MNQIAVVSPREPAAPALPAALWDVVERALAKVETEWQHVAEDAPSREEVTSHLGLLRDALLLEGSRSLELPRTVLVRRLLDLVRRAIVQEAAKLSPRPDAGQLLSLLDNLEHIARALEPDWAQHFADRLSGPDGMELVVEVAHDLRSPLTSILFLAETLQRARSGPINAVQERQLGLIYSAAFGLSSLASDVIELARGGDRLVDLDPLPFSIADIFESVRDIVQPIAEEKGLQVKMEMAVPDFRVGYPVALSRVLLNLTTNALKFTSEGVVELRADAGDGNVVVFSVRDTGRGIPPQALLTLFEPFRRRQKQGEYAFSGAGLGLSICRKLVEAMRSTLQVETKGDGTRFYFVLDLPLARERT
ncbi:MAG: HAMP domain-containing sensor histidine kinase [Gemmatimonadales bacterium]